MRHVNKRTGSAFVAIALVSLSLIQVASAGVDRRTATPVKATTITITGGEFFFKPKTKSIPKPGKVTFVFKNVGTIPHDFKIAGKQTPLVAAKKSAKLVITFKKKGKYPFICTVPGHLQAGMKGVFTVL